MRFHNAHKGTLSVSTGQSKQVSAVITTMQIAAYYIIYIHVKFYVCICKYYITIYANLNIIYPIVECERWT